MLRHEKVRRGTYARPRGESTLPEALLWFEVVRRGYLQIGRWRGAPVLVHWSTPIGAFVFGRFQLVPAFWLGYVALVLLHELGHAWFVRRYKAKVLQVEVHALGGLCTWQGTTTAIQRSLIAWGGVVAQFLAFLVTQAILAIEGPPPNDAMAQLAYLFTHINLWIIAINLLPVAPLDGAAAWRLFPLLLQRQRARADRAAIAKHQAAVRDSKAKLREADAMEEEEVVPPRELERVADDVLSRLKKDP